MSNSISWSEIFASLNNKTDLTSAQSLWAMNTVMDGNATNDEIKQLEKIKKSSFMSELKYTDLILLLKYCKTMIYIFINYKIYI